MDIYFTVKSIGKRKAFLTKRVYTLSSKPDTLRALINELVVYHVRLHNELAEGPPLVTFLTGQEIEEQGAGGKVGFGTRYDERLASENEAVQTALIAFEDGLYRVFIREEEVSELDAQIDIQDGDDVVFIKFTMLAGRLW